MKGNQVLSIIWSKKYKFFDAHIYENHGPYIYQPLKRQSQHVIGFVVCINVFEAYLTNSVDSDQTDAASGLIGVPHCSPLNINSRLPICNRLLRRYFKGK